MRLSRVYILFTSTTVLLGILMVWHCKYHQKTATYQLLEKSKLVHALKLTDLCLFTEARYTRNPSMADRFAPFQDHPGALEHFPSGSLISPPNLIRHEKRT